MRRRTISPEWSGWWTWAAERVFPGLPLKLAFPRLELHLIESVGKKTAFLEHISRVLGLRGVTVHTGRAEALARRPELRDGFDLALARGVARLPLLLEYTLPFCRAGGYAIALKHGGLEDELAEARFALSELGGREGGRVPGAAGRAGRRPRGGRLREGDAHARTLPRAGLEYRPSGR